LKGGWPSTCRERGDERNRFSGCGQASGACTSSTRAVASFRGRASPTDAAGAFADELLALLAGEIDDQGVHPLPGAAALLDRVRGRVPVAVASNAPHALLAQALERAGLAGCFDAMLGADDVSRPKPAPDLYLRAVELLNAQPHATVAFEDSAPGVTSARAAGLYVIAVGAPDVAPLDAHERAESLEDPLVAERLGLVDVRGIYS